MPHSASSRIVSCRAGFSTSPTILCTGPSPVQTITPWLLAAPASKGAASTAGMAPNAIRLGLASPHADVLVQALDTLAGIARSTPADLVTD